MLAQDKYQAVTNEIEEIQEVAYWQQQGLVRRESP